MSRLSEEVAKVVTRVMQEDGKIKYVRKWRRMHGLDDQGLTDEELLKWMLSLGMDDARNFVQWVKHWENGESGTIFPEDQDEPR